MESDVSIESCEPTHGVTILDPAAGVIYLVPSTTGTDGRPAYMSTDALLMKRAVADGVGVEYALPADEREFVDHFSAGIEVIGLTVAIVNLVPSTIQGIHALIQLIAIRRGYTGDSAKQAKVKLKIDYIKTASLEARGIKVEGDADGVVEALKALSSGS